MASRDRSIGYVAGYTEMKRRAARARRVQFLKEELPAWLMLGLLGLFCFTVGVQVGRLVGRQEANVPHSQEMNR